MYCSRTKEPGEGVPQCVSKSEERGKNQRLYYGLTDSEFKENFWIFERAVIIPLILYNNYSLNEETNGKSVRDIGCNIKNDVVSCLKTVFSTSLLELDIFS